MLKENIISEVERIYGDAYETDMIENNGVSDYVTLKCKKHALIFRKRLSRLLKGSGCPLCSGKARKTFEQFVEDARKVHGDKYEYNDSNYVNSHTKIGITCPEHGEFIGGEETFAKTVELDMKKRKLCKENGIKLFYYANYRYNFPYKVFMKKDKLLEEIKKVKVN